MKRIAKKALIASIKKWEANLEASCEDVKRGKDNCQLCVEFWNKDCEGCPVFNKTGKEHCQLTPYERAEYAHDVWSNLIEDDEDPEYISDAEQAFRDAAQDEINFLRSLR